MESAHRRPKDETDDTGSGDDAFWLGLLMTFAVGGASLMLAQMLPALSPLLFAAVLGAVVTNVRLGSQRTRAGAHVAAKHLLRCGIVLIGLRLAIGDVATLGIAGIIAVLVLTTATFVATIWLGARLGLPRPVTMLIAAGFSICGASAVAAMSQAVDADEEDVAFSIALVTACGGAAMVLLPALGAVLGLSAAEFGAWAGASVHDVGQVVAAASTQGGSALRLAVVVKLTRVLLLAPLVAWGAATTRRAPSAATASGERRLPAVPGFLLLFLVAALLRSTGALPAPVLSLGDDLAELCLVMALAGHGLNLELARLRQVGGRPLLLGLAAWGFIAGASLLAISGVGV